MVILAAPLTYLVLSLMGIGLGHDLLGVKNPPAQQVSTASQSRNEVATAHVVAE